MGRYVTNQKRCVKIIPEMLGFLHPAVQAVLDLSIRQGDNKYSSSMAVKMRSIFNYPYLFKTIADITYTSYLCIMYDCICI